MKIIHITLLLTLIAYVYLNCESISTPSKKACNDGLTDVDKNTYGYSHCCYYKYSYNGKTEESCEGINKPLYDNIKAYITGLEIGGLKVDSLDCGASYLKLGIFALIFLFI